MPKRFKRFQDIIVSILAILILMPFWILLGLIIFMEDRGPVLYWQKRVGRHQRLFYLIKFRSMRVNNIAPLELGAIKHDHALVTKIGYFIRRFKFDETPQFLNVLKGEMSLVGPRPCLPERIETMSLAEQKRFDFLPGLTGWAEVNGNVELTWEEQVFLDLWYVNNWSFILDLKIFLKTFLIILFGSKKNEIALENAKNKS